MTDKPTKPRGGGAAIAGALILIAAAAIAGGPLAGAIALGAVLFLGGMFSVVASKINSAT
jgi:hypothetical protein